MTTQAVRSALRSALVAVAAAALCAAAAVPANAAQRDRPDAAPAAVGAPVAMSVPTPMAVDGDMTVMDTRPPGCSWRFKDPNVRYRTINRYTYMHEMSNPPVCAPHGPILGTLSPGSTFRVYYSDPHATYWCYGYSVQIARLGYILCDAYD